MPYYLPNMNIEKIKALDIDLLRRLVTVKLKIMVSHDELLSDDHPHIKNIEAILNQDKTTAAIVDDLTTCLNNIPKRFLNRFGLGLKSKLFTFLQGNIEETIYLACLKQHEQAKEVESLKSRVAVAEERTAILESEKAESKGFADFSTAVHRYESQIRILESKLEGATAENGKLEKGKSDLELHLRQALEREARLQKEVVKLNTIINKLMTQAISTDERQSELERRFKALEGKRSISDAVAVVSRSI